MKSLSRRHKIVGFFALLGIIIAGVTGSMYFATRSHAEIASLGWDFNNPLNYSYLSNKIEILDGVARLKPSLPPLGPQLPSPINPGDQILPDGFCSATITALNSITLPPGSQLTSFMEVANTNGGLTGYQFSFDNGPWLFWNGGAWAPTIGANSYTAAPEVAPNLVFAPPASEIRFRARLANVCGTTVELVDVRFEYLYTLPGYAVTTSIPDLTITDAEGNLVERTEQSVYVRSAGIPVLFTTPSADVDFALPELGSTVLSSSLAGAWVNMLPEVQVQLLSWELLIPKNSPSNAVRICPQAVSAEALTHDCVDGVVLTQEASALGDYALTSLEDVNF